MLLFLEFGFKSEALQSEESMKFSDYTAIGLTHNYIVGKVRKDESASSPTCMARASLTH